WAVRRFLGHHSRNPAIVVIITKTLGRVTPHLLRLCYQQQSSGSGLLLSYLGECGSSSYPTAVACISPVFHGQLWFEYELPWLYHWIALMYRKFQINSYATALGSVMDIAKILYCNSLRDMEELIFCAPKQSDHRLSMKPDWPSYWERNEPLRDANEVAVPVLCLCSKGDPLLPPLSTVLEALFHNSPYFMLAVTEQGGHCGFMHSHSVVLEYFRVVASFFRVEEKAGFKHEQEDFTWNRSYTH
uniref:Abhydrolase domain containing 15 n=1 Tax=Cyprinus carpio TaxID=7962 RepID=A0A8C1UW20_CYPCA